MKVFFIAENADKYLPKEITSSAWKALKPSLPFGTFPLLQVDDVTIAESLTIYRYSGIITHSLTGKILP